MSTTLYLTATEHINKHPYDVMTQAHFTGIHPLVERGIFKGPIYEPMDHDIKQKAKIPIARMVELFISKSSFDIIHDSDVLYILHYIDAYVQEVYHLRETPEVKSYLEKILSLRERVYFIFCKVLNHHPQWKEAYEGQVGIFDVMAKLYSGSGMGINLPQTYKEELRICPTIRAHQKAEQIQHPVTTTENIYSV